MSAFVDPKNVTRLTQIFELEGCHRLDLEHHVPAIIDDKVLQSNLRLSNITSLDLMQRIPPKLKLPADFNLDCLHGKYRIAAAKSFLYLPDDKWWTVDLYSDRLSQTLRRDIREDYANSRNFCDGDIFRQIRYCQLNHDDAGEGRWWARLSDSKRKDVKSLQRSKELKPLALALDELLPLLNVKCPEELRHYVHHIRDYWLRVLDKNHELKPLVDFGTIRLLQIRNPWASAVDNDVVKDLMRDHILFPLITDLNLRSRILKNILATDCIIPSLYTFIEDTKWLEPCAKAIRNLLPTNCRKSTYKSMFGSYQGANIPDGVVLIQENEATGTQQPGSELDAIECGYRQLWLFAWRYFPELSAMLPRKNAGKVKPRPKASNERCWHRFAGLARSLGFESDNIDRLLRQDPDAAMALEFIRQARPDYLYQMPNETRTAAALEICHILSSMEWQMNSTSGESRSRQCSEISPQLRCGRPYEQSHKESKSRFFYPDIYATKKKTLTHFSINRDIFHAFFESVPPVTLEQAGTVSDMDEDTDNAQPVTTTEPVQPVTTTEPAQPVTTTEPAQPVTATEPAQPDVSPISERPEVPEDQQLLQESSGPLLPGEADTNIETTGGGDLVSWRDETTTQPTVDTSRMAEIVLQTQSMNDAEVTALFETDLQALDLFEHWERRCKIGDIFAILVYQGEFAHYCKEPALETELGRGILPASLKQLAGAYYFATYIPEKKTLRCIGHDNILRYAMDSRHDGVIYIFRRPTDDATRKEVPKAYRTQIRDETCQSITGETTKARLFKVAERFKKKRGQPSELESETYKL
ncbi:hypothetical protein OEA41_010759 [Lepraria neglecta]|uniref:Uncharacterized protein n=1 Tax=Lepraria neglecta TaxID=209136 RepID=A0AAD9Z0D0_9LECA|nr:hypothetical protein OEA41_010759 [Lepraria neglecta]